MELILEKGIDKIKFGMTRPEVEKILGIADRIRINKDDGDKLVLDYNTLRLRLVFYPDENNRLGYIETSNYDLFYNNYKILNSNIDFAKKEIFGDVINDWETEEYYSFSTYFNQRFWLTLHVEFEKINHIELGVPFKNEQDYKWPEEL